MILSRLVQLQPLPLTLASRRSYSYFSQKPGGGGRFFNSSKPHKVPATRGGPNKGPTSNSTAESSASTTTAGPTVAAASQAGESHEDPSSSTPSSSLTPFAPSHPDPVLPTLHLHSFFSQHRPLLLLDQPVANLFRPGPIQFTTSLKDAQAAAAASSAARDASLMHEDSMDDPEGDADTARSLARAMVLHRVNAGKEWAATLSVLGIESEGNVIDMDSVKRKRKKKITKHKYKKRRKLQRAERRKLGK